MTSTTRHLGVDLQSWSPDRLPLINAVDELVILQPMPSMPIGFWRDDDGSRYCAAYLSTNGPTAAHPGCGGTATGCVTAGSPATAETVRQSHETCWRPNSIGK